MRFGLGPRHTPFTYSTAVGTRWGAGQRDSHHAFAYRIFSFASSRLKETVTTVYRLFRRTSIRASPEDMNEKPICLALLIAASVDVSFSSWSWNGDHSESGTPVACCREKYRRASCALALTAMSRTAVFRSRRPSGS
jgi:hypothetical protein